MFAPPFSIVLGSMEGRKQLVQRRTLQRKEEDGYGGGSCEEGGQQRCNKFEVGSIKIGPPKTSDRRKKQ